MRNQLTRWMTAACGLVLALAPSAMAQAPAEPAKPIAVVGLTSYDELMQDADYLGGLLGQPGASQMAEMMLQQMTMGKGLAGLDKSRPLGVIVQASGMAPSFGICLPVSDQAALLGVAGGFGAQTQDMGNGVTQVTMMGQDGYAKNTGTWTLLSMAPDALESLPADPGTVLGPLTTEYDLAFQVNVQNLPEAWRQMATDMMSNAAKAGVTQLPDESAEDFAARQAQLDTAMKAQQQQFLEMDQFTVGLAIASEMQKVLLDFGYTAVPGTALAEQMAANSQATTNFAGFAQPDAAASMSFAAKVTGATMQQISDGMRQVREQTNANIDKESTGATAEALKAAAADFIDAFEATAKAGSMDGGAVLLANAGSLTFVAGGLVTEPAKIESGLKKLTEAAAGDADVKLPPVQWSAATHGDVTFHVMQVPVPDEKAKTLFGDTCDVVVGLGPQSAYVAFGRNAQDELKKVIDASASAPGKAIPPMEATVSLGKMLTMAQSIADDDKKPMLGMVAGMLTSDSSGKDHLHMIAEGVPSGMRMRLEVEEGVLKAAGTAAMMGAMPGAGPPVGVGAAQ